MNESIWFQHLVLVAAAVECVFCQGRWRLARDTALESTSAVTGLAIGPIGGAPSSAPYAATGAGWDIECPRLAIVELAATAGRNAGCPDGEGAVVTDGECAGGGAADEKEDEKGNGDRRIHARGLESCVKKL